MRDKRKSKTFLLKTERFHPIVLKHLAGREDIITFRQLQGEMAKYFRFLRNYTGISEDQNFSVKLIVNPEASLTPSEKEVDSLTIKTGKGAGPSAISESIINDIFLKHLDSALEEIKNTCLDLLLEEIEEVAMEGSVEQVIAVKKSLEGRENDQTTTEEEIADLFKPKSSPSTPTDR